MDIRPGGRRDQTKVGPAQETLVSTSERDIKLRPRKPRFLRAENTAVVFVALMKAARKAAREKRRIPARAPRVFQQRCVVRTRYSPNDTRGQWQAHGHYISRESATELPRLESGFDASGKNLPIAERLEDWQQAGDERIWKIMLSPERGEDLDLHKLTRDMMTQIEQDLGRKLEWIAAVHHNTEHPHIHIAIRGVDRDGQSYRFERGYIRNRLLEIGRNLCTAQLGYRIPDPTLQPHQYTRRYGLSEVPRQQIQR